MRRVRLLAVVGLLALLLAACGSNTKTPGAGSTSPAATTPSPSSPARPTVTDKGTLDIIGKSAVTIEQDNDSEFYFKPTFFKTTPGQKLTVTLKNEGSASHTFTIPSLSIDEELAAGTNKTITVTLPSTDVAFFCRFHVTNGMWGSFFVGAAPTATPEALGTGSGSGSGYGYYK